MKFTSPASLALVLASTAVAYPTKVARQTCSGDSYELLCNGSSQFGICNFGEVVWQTVSQGTECVCSGSSCSVVATDSGATVIASPSTVSAASVASVATTSPAAASTNTGAVAENPATPDTTTVAAANNNPKKTTTTLAVVTTVKTSSAVPTTYATATTATAPAATTTTSSSSSSGGSTYVQYFTGNGDTSAGWPAESAWLDFDTMWSTNLENIISASCTQFGAADNSDAESADIKSAIQSIASSSGVDARFILAVVMQESNGCVRVPTTNYGVTNPGLMQSHNGAHSCAGVSPCSADEITGMIQDGTEGTSSGDGLQQILAEVGGSDASSYYKASVVYNSGSLPSNGILQDATATACYASDVANRLIGWSKGTSGCTA